MSSNFTPLFSILPIMEVIDFTLPERVNLKPLSVSFCFIGLANSVINSFRCSSVSFNREAMSLYAFGLIYFVARSSSSLLIL